MLAQRDSKENLKELRKLYLKLEKALNAVYDDAAKPDNLEADKNAKKRNEILEIILLSEASRRICQEKNTKAESRSTNSSNAFKAASAFTMLLNKHLPPALDKSAFTSNNEAAFALSFCILQEHSALLQAFDERYAGYFYQFSCASKRELALKRIQSADKKSKKEDIISFSQLYTPDWAADYLLANTILPQWQGNCLAMDRRWTNLWLKQKAKVQVSAGEISVLDPACGAGHILLRAFDLLMELYNAEGYSKEKCLSLILNGKLAGCDLDKDALWVTAFSLILKAKLLAGEVDGPLELHLCDVSQSINSDDFDPGTLHRHFSSDNLLGKKYTAVVTNPPYIGRRLMDRRLKTFLKEHYFSAHQDLSAAFLLRALELTAKEGRVGFITQASLLYLPSYSELRKRFIQSRLLSSVVELGTGVFPLASGEKINSMLIVLTGTKEQKQYPLFLDLKESKCKEMDLADACREATDGLTAKKTMFFERNENDFLANRGNSFNYKCPLVLSKILKQSEQLGRLVEIKQGLATSDNERFLRFWWDVPPDEIGKRWRPYIKGAGSERWHSPCRMVVDWGISGERIKSAVETAYPYLKGRVAWVVKNEQFYFRPGLTFSFVSTGNLAVRKLPPDCIFDVGGSALFGKESDLNILLAYLNSSFAALCAEFLNPTYNFQVGDIKLLPLPAFNKREKISLSELAAEAFALKAWLNSFDETQIYYEAPAEVVLALNETDADKTWSNLQTLSKARIDRLEQIEAVIDELVIASLKREHQLDGKQTKSILDLMERKQRKSRSANVFFQSKGDFAASVLHAFISAELDKSFYLATNLTSPFKGKLTDSLKAWFDRNLDTPLVEYLGSAFNKKQEKLFQNSPQIVCTASKDRELVIIGSRSLRRFFNNRTDSHKNLDGAGETSAYLESKLKDIENWTGKDLLRCLRQSQESLLIRSRKKT